MVTLEISLFESTATFVPTRIIEQDWSGNLPLSNRPTRARKKLSFMWCPASSGVLPQGRYEGEPVKSRPLQLLSERIGQLRSLNDDWDGYGAPAPSEYAVSEARSLLERCNEYGMLPDRVAASVEGGIVLYFLNAVRYAMIEVDNEGEVVALISESGLEPEAWVVDESDCGLESSLDRISASFQS